MNYDLPIWKEPAAYMGLFVVALISGAFWLSSLDMVGGGIVFAAPIYSLFSGLLVTLITLKVRLNGEQRGAEAARDMWGDHANWT